MPSAETVLRQPTGAAAPAAGRLAMLTLATVMVGALMSLLDSTADGQRRQNRRSGQRSQCWQAS